MNEQFGAKAPGNWWEDFFEGLSVQLWLEAIPLEHTGREAERIAAALALPAGAAILDVPCGGGRLSLPLAARGYRVTGVDSSREFLRAVASALRPGGRFLLETPMVLEQLLGHLQDRPWWKVSDLHLLVRNDYDHTRSRLEIEYTFMGNGRIEVRRGSHRAYRYAELVDLLRTSGFDDVRAAEPWSRESATTTFIATRR